MAYKNKETQKIKAKEYRDLNKSKIYERQKEWRKNNPDKVKLSEKRSREKRKDKEKERWKEYYKLNSRKLNDATLRSRANRTPEEKEFYLQKRREYTAANKDKINAKQRENLIKNPNAKLARNLRARIRDYIKKGYRSGSAVSELGCSIDELRLHIESLFTEGMNWDNHGPFGWHIDHKLPLSFFDLSDIEQFKMACHWQNLQPLWWHENIKKTNKIIVGVNDKQEDLLNMAVGRSDNAGNDREMHREPEGVLQEA